MGTQISYIWKDRKRIIFGLPWTFTKYTINDEKLILQAGLFTTVMDEVRLYRILDTSLSRTLYQKLFNIGTIRCISADKSLPEFELKNIKNPVKVQALLSDTVEECREKKRVSSREFMSSDDDDFECDHDHN